MNNKPNKNQIKSKLSAEKYAYLKAEAQAPYKGLRKFIYLACAVSGSIGAFIFFMQFIAGTNVNSTLPNFALQIGVVALMIWLFRLESQ